MAGKYTLDELKTMFSEEGCELLEDEYLGCNQKLRYKCVCGNEAYTQTHRFKRGIRCRHCGAKKVAALKKLTIDQAKEVFVNGGCELLEDNYENNHTAMRYRCSCGNSSKITLSDFKTGKRCKACGVSKVAEKLAYDYSFVSSYFSSAGCILLDKTYTNNHAKLNYICSCGNKSKITFKSFLNGNRCKECSSEKRKGENHHNWNSERTERQRRLGRGADGPIRKWARHVKKRDDNTCVKCGISEEIMVAHHIESYDAKEELRFDVSNGATLCRRCHKSFHMTYGYKNNTKSQFGEFLRRVKDAHDY